MTIAQSFLTLPAVSASEQVAQHNVHNCQGATASIVTDSPTRKYCRAEKDRFDFHELLLPRDGPHSDAKSRHTNGFHLADKTVSARQIPNGKVAQHGQASTDWVA
ncbi:MAG: hypothetical protein U9N87_07880 [Planctomycetota bacterium]|nr:hypothetical protein [Planctomycetota bacterium]